MDPEEILRKWFAGEITLTFDQVEDWRAKLLLAHQKGDRTPHSFWWVKAAEGSSGWLYRATGEKLAADHNIVALKDAAGDHRGWAWLRLGRMDIPVVKITWGKKQFVYVRYQDLPALIEN